MTRARSKFIKTLMAQGASKREAVAEAERARRCKKPYIEYWRCSDYNPYNYYIPPILSHNLGMYY